MRNSFSFITSFVIVLCLTSSLSNAQDDTVPDLSCDTGLCSGRACCPSGCGKCGGSGCGRRVPELGIRCCGGWIKKQNRPCTSFGPPCMVQKPAKCNGLSDIIPTSPAASPAASPSSSAPASSTAAAPPSVSTSPSMSASPTSNINTPTFPSGEWTSITNTLNGKPSARHENCFVMAEGRAFLIGGRGKRPVEMFDPRTRTWSKVADMPTNIQLHHMQCVYYKGFIFIASSWYGPSPRENNNKHMWTFNVKNYTWKRRKGLPKRRRRGGAAAVVYKDRIYVLCGNRGGHGPPSQTLGWVDYYDLTTRKWVTNLASLPQEHARDHVGAAVMGNKICIAGGRNGGASQPFGAVVTSTWCYDPENNSWENMNAPIPAGRAGAATATMCDGRMVVIGGEGRFSKAFDRVDAFDGEKWTTLKPIVRSRHGTGVAVSNCGTCGHMFIAAGSGARGGRPELDSTEVYIPSGTPGRCSQY